VIIAYNNLFQVKKMTVVKFVIQMRMTLIITNRGVYRGIGLLDVHIGSGEESPLRYLLPPDAFAAL